VSWAAFLASAPRKSPSCVFGFGCWGSKGCQWRPTQLADAAAKPCPSPEPTASSPGCCPVRLQRLPPLARPLALALPLRRRRRVLLQ
jgi:hypothetical protein